jgi:hypothetical protein
MKKILYTDRDVFQVGLVALFQEILGKMKGIVCHHFKGILLACSMPLTLTGSVVNNSIACRRISLSPAIRWHIPANLVQASNHQIWGSCDLRRTEAGQAGATHARFARSATAR